MLRFVRCLCALLLWALSSHAVFAVEPMVVRDSVGSYLPTTYYALQPDGSLWSLKLGYTPVQIGSDIAQIAQGDGSYASAYAISSAGRLYAIKAYGVQLGSPFDSDVYLSVDRGVALLADGSLWSLSGASKKQIGTEKGFVKIWNSYPLFALKADATLWAYGVSSGYNFGDGTPASSSNIPVLKQVGSDYVRIFSDGSSNYFGLKTDGSLWGWGLNYLGSLGINSGQNKIAKATLIGSGFTQVSPGYNFTVAIKADGTLWNWGFNDAGQLGTNDNHWTLTPQQRWSGYTKAVTGPLQTVGIQNDGSLWVWGSNQYLGIDSNDPFAGYTPQRAGDGYTHVWSPDDYIARKTDGSLWIWGVFASKKVPTLLMAATPSTSSTTRASCLFTWLEGQYGQYLSGKPASTQTANEYAYRYYDGSKAYLAFNSSDSNLYYLAGGSLVNLGDFSGWWKKAGCN